MYKELHIGDEEKFIDKFVQNSGELILLGKGDGSEVMIQKIRAGETVFIEPSTRKETMEFFYILEGEIEVEKDNIKTLLKSGNHFYVHHLKETIQFNTLTDLKLIYFSTQSQFQYISKIIRELVELSKKVEEKDMYTHGHTKRVKDYAIKIGSNLNLSKEKIENLGFAALFHDLGKINVPDGILNKPGRLTPEEFDFIKKHPVDGAKLVKKTYYENIDKIIEQHHERIDGSGYPYGIKGDKILIEAKIIAISDTYDAMTSDRPYRKGLSSQIAVDELKRLKGIHYDENLVDIFIDILKDEKVIDSI